MRSWSPRGWATLAICTLLLPSHVVFKAVAWCLRERVLRATASSSFDHPQPKCSCDGVRVDSGSAAENVLFPHPLVPAHHPQVGRNISLNIQYFGSLLLSSGKISKTNFRFVHMQDVRETFPQLSKLFLHKIVEIRKAWTSELLATSPASFTLY